jgi:hypothetical protein
LAQPTRRYKLPSADEPLLLAAPAAGREVAGGTNKVALVQELFTVAAQELGAVVAGEGEWAQRPASVLDSILNVGEAVMRQQGQCRGQAAGRKRGRDE